MASVLRSARVTTYLGDLGRRLAPHHRQPAAKLVLDRLAALGLDITGSSV